MLMERYGIDADQAFGMLRQRAEKNGGKLSEMAERVTESRMAREA